MRCLPRMKKEFYDMLTEPEKQLVCLFEDTWYPRRLLPSCMNTPPYSGGEVQARIRMGGTNTCNARICRYNGGVRIVIPSGEIWSKWARYDPRYNNIYLYNVCTQPPVSRLRTNCPHSDEWNKFFEPYDKDCIYMELYNC